MPKREHMAGPGSSFYLTGDKSNRLDDTYSNFYCHDWEWEIISCLILDKLLKNNNDTGQCLLRTGLAGTLTVGID